MRVTTYRPTNQHAAHRDVTAVAAQDTPVDWPVSGDQTIRQYGLDGRRITVDVWKAPGVKPKHATAGIRVGDTIATLSGATGVVTRVGTVAGWYMLGSVECRWEAWQVKSITPAP